MKFLGGDLWIRNIRLDFATDLDLKQILWNDRPSAKDPIV